MKSGGQKPFTDETEQSKEQEEKASNIGQLDQTGERKKVDSNTGNTGQFNRSDLPRIVVRDSVKEDRDGSVHQLFVYQEKETYHDLEG